MNNGTDAVYAAGLSRRTLEPVTMSPMWWSGKSLVPNCALLLRSTHSHLLRHRTRQDGQYMSGPCCNTERIDLLESTRLSV